MPKSSVLGSPAPVQGGAPKNGFPMSQNFTFTAAAGMFLPVYKQVLNIGESVKGLPTAFVRTEPLLAPAMADLDLYVDVFFVPMTHIIGMFNDWFVQVDDSKSALWNTSSWKNVLPVVGKTVGTGDDAYTNAFGWMTEDIFQCYQFERPSDYGFSDSKIRFGFGAHRLAMHLGYNAQGYFSAGSNLDQGDASNLLPQFQNCASSLYQPAFCPYYFAAYQKIYYDYYRDSQKESNNVKAYNLDDVMNSGNMLFYPSSMNDPRLGMFALRYRYRAHDYFTHTYPSPLFNMKGMLPNAMANLSRIQNWLTGEYPSVFYQAPYSGQPGNYNVGINTYADLKKATGGSDFRTDTESFYTIDGETLTSDSPYELDFGGTGNNSGHIRVTDNDDERKLLYHSHFVDLDDIINNVTSDNTPISLAQIRSAFALDKLLRLSNRAGKHADDQMFAQFGEKIPQGVSGEVYHIKGYHTIFHIGEVVQQANTVNAAGQDVPLGELAGRGVAMLNGNEKFSFKAPCTGVLMAIMSISPRYKYAFTIEKDGMKAYIEDWFKPTMDHQGMQPMFSYEYGNSNNTIRGGTWQWRYMEDKVKYDKTTYVFGTTSKNPWTFVQPWFGSHPNVENWPAAAGNYGISATDMFVLPNDTNNMFVVQFNGDIWYPGSGSSSDPRYTLNAMQFLSNYLRDPFTIDFNMQCSKVSQMSTYGEPSLGGI